MKLRKNDLIVIGIILICTLGIYLGYRLSNSGSADTILVTVAGNEYARLDPGKDGIYLIREGEKIRSLDDTKKPANITDKRYNILVVKNRSASMVEAGCPDLLCVHQKDISLNGEQIVCLPNKVVVRFISNEDAPVDVVTN